MTFINPIEILKLQNYSVSEIDSSAIKKAKKKLFADIDLSDDGVLDYKGVSLTKTDCETAIEKLDNTEYVEFYSYLANDNQPLNDFLVNGNERFFDKFMQESIYKLPEFVNFISPYFAPRFDKALLSNFMEFDRLSLISTVIIEDILQTQLLINPTDINIAYKSLSVALTSRISETEQIAQKIKDETSDYDDDNIDEVVDLITDLFPADFLNLLPAYFQSQINKIAAAINQLQLAIWDNLHNPSVCRQLLEHLLALNIESVSKQTFENNYQIVKKADEKIKSKVKVQQYIDKLLELLNFFENKAKTIANAKELIYQANTHLFNIKAISQDDDSIYISLSTRVAFIAQNFVIEEVNKAQSSNDQFDSIFGFTTLKSTLKNAWEVTQLIGSLEMQSDFIENRYNPNRNTLRDICSKLSVATPETTFARIPQCNFVILDSTITHTGKEGKSLPITTPFIRGNIRYIGLNLKIEAFGNQSVKFNLKYIQPNGTVKTGTSSPEGFSFAEDKIINANTKLIRLSGWGNAEKSTYDVGTHYIEVWIEGCMVYRKSFVVDWSQAEKIENAKRKAERRDTLKQKQNVRNYWTKMVMITRENRLTILSYKKKHFLRPTVRLKFRKIRRIAQYYWANPLAHT
ncbi:MAG: hypothetical protein LBS43_09680 [Prevotellaceae bacterium]|jgi:hypothetical protein|nr:hypothetical protein [Prevotellaceae bacterium]